VLRGAQAGQQDQNREEAGVHGGASAAAAAGGTIYHICSIGPATATKTAVLAAVVGATTAVGKTTIAATWRADTFRAASSSTVVQYSYRIGQLAQQEGVQLGVAGKEVSGGGRALEGSRDALQRWKRVQNWKQCSRQQAECRGEAAVTNKPCAQAAKKLCAVRAG
jgi:hypothetical protein